MSLLWGDIHNHCEITYGSGSLQGALKAARTQLDFCSVTPHAMWEDIYEENQDTERILKMHKEGFDKIRKTWPEVRKVMEEANNEDLVTFHSFEMHSCYYGDYHILSPDPSLELVYCHSPYDVLPRQKARAIVIPHHIGYCSNLRGIRWSSYREAESPVVEVCSKHGCSMNDDSPYSYYHTMGPREPLNLVKEGLALGNRFSFVGSTDHHAGFPGSYGDGKMAVLAADKTRETIWEAILQGRTYAVTGDKIKCNFTVDGHIFGSKISCGKTRRIEYSVEASDAIDRIVIYKNYEPIFTSLGGHSGSGDNLYKIRLELGWGYNESPFLWRASVNVSGGKIKSFETCFRGMNLMSPANYTGKTKLTNDLQNSVLSFNNTACEFTCETTKNPTALHPQTSGVVFEVCGSPQTELTFTINGKVLIFSVAQLLKNGAAGHTKAYASEAYKIHRAISLGEYTLSGELLDESMSAHDYYHMEVGQKNGHYAFVSPVFVDRKE